MNTGSVLKITSFKLILLVQRSTHPQRSFTQQLRYLEIAVTNIILWVATKFTQEYGHVGSELQVSRGHCRKGTVQ